MARNMSGILHRLHCDRDSASKRVDYCREELARFEGYATPAKEHQRVMLNKLARDARLAEMDYAHATLQLEDALREEGLSM